MQQPSSPLNDNANTMRHRNPLSHQPSTALTIGGKGVNDNSKLRRHRWRMGPGNNYHTGLAVFFLCIMGLWSSSVSSNISNNMRNNNDDQNAKDVDYLPPPYALPPPSAADNVDAQSNRLREEIFSIEEAQSATTDSRKVNNNNTLRRLEFHEISLKANELFMWSGAQIKLCKHIQEEKNKIENNRQQKPLVAYLKRPCARFHARNQHGSLVYGIYAMHLAAMTHDIDLIFQCEEETAESNAFWWLQSNPEDIIDTRALLQKSTTEIYDETPLSSKDACTGMGMIPFGYAFNLARAQLRNMAIGIFGARHFGYEKKSDNKTTLSSHHAPLYLDEELDQVSIHFRCGDVMKGFQTINYGMVPFDVYRSVLLGKNYSSIGIVTQPFDKGKILRDLDAEYSNDCKHIVTSLQNYLSDHFSSAKVSIRNSQSDTIPMVMARLVLAEHTICIRSTFCMFPALATFGEATFLPGGVAYFLDPIAQFHSNVHLLDSTKVPYLFSHQIKEIGLNRTIDWLQNEIMT